MVGQVLNRPMVLPDRLAQYRQKVGRWLNYHLRSRRRTPTVLQMEAVECGAASLTMILGYYGKIVPLADLREACGISRDGAKATNLLTAARQLGLQAKGFKTDLSGLQQQACPYIVHWNFNHFLVVEGFYKQRVFLNDPAIGPRTVSLTEFNESFTGVVLTFTPSETFQKGGQKPSLTKALWSRLRQSIVPLLFCILVGFLLVLPGLAMPTFLQMFVDQVLIHRQEDWLQPLIVGMLFTAGLTGLLTRLQLQILRRLKMQLSMRMSSRFIWHLLHLPVGFYDQRSSGEISSRIQFNDRLASLLSGQLATTAIACIMLVFYGMVMLQYDRILTLITVSIVVVNLLVSRWVSRQRKDLNTRMTGEQGKVSAIAIAGLQSIETIKASGLESDFFTRWAGYYAKAINARQEIESLSQQIGVLPTFLASVSAMLLLVIGGFRVMDHVLTIGQLIAFQSLAQQFMQPVNQVFQLGNDIQELEGTMNRLDDVLRNPTDPLLAPHLNAATAPHLDATTQPKLQGVLELRNLTFGYNRSAPPLIENFSLTLKPGQRVALVGGSGSGKSTIAKVVAGLYAPWSGDILLDGQPRQQIPRPVLVNSVAMVQQDILLFAGTVRDNLTLWDTTISEGSLVQACRDAAVHEVIAALPGGYSANLLEGAANLSGGQRQRLEIARSLVIDPTILIMDEATSALDSETEKIIDYSLRLRGCTCLIVAHRLSTIRDCDEIIVLDRGKVVQRGSHDELRQVEGHYLELIKSEGATGEEV